MIVGDPYLLSVIAEKVSEWNATKDDDNGFISLCIDGNLFPKHMINATINTSLFDILKVLKAIPEDETLASMNYEQSFEAIYNRVFPSDYEIENDYRYLLAPYAITDEGCHVFAVRTRDKIRIMGAELQYDIENSRHILSDIVINVAEVSDGYIQKLIQGIESYLSKE